MSSIPRIQAGENLYWTTFMKTSLIKKTVINYKNSNKKPMTKELRNMDVAEENHALSIIIGEEGGN